MRGVTKSLWFNLFIYLKLRKSVSIFLVFDLPLFYGATPQFLIPLFCTLIILKDLSILTHSIVLNIENLRFTVKSKNMKYGW